MAPPIIDRYYVGQGDATIFTRSATGQRQAGRIIGNATEIRISGSAQELVHKENRTGQRQTDNRIIWGADMFISLTVDNFSTQNLALFMQGDASAVVAGSATNEIQLYSPGVMQLNRFNILTTPAPTVRKVGAGADWATNTYRIQRSGLVEILTDPPAVGVVAGDQIQFNYSFGAHEQNVAFSRGAIEYWFSTHALNKAEQDAPVLLDCFRVSFRPEFEFQAIGEDYGTLTLQGQLLQDPFQAASTGRYFMQRALVGP